MYESDGIAVGETQKNKSYNTKLAIGMSIQYQITSSGFFKSFKFVRPLKMYLRAQTRN